MQRLVVWSARRCGFRVLPSSSCSRLSSFSSGPDHDDYWAAAKTEAHATPAYQQATAPIADAHMASTTTAVGEDLSGMPGAVGPGSMPLGEAYGPSSTRPPYAPSRNNPREGAYDLPEAVFDMESSTHLSPMRQVRVRTFKGTTLVDIRQFFRGDGMVLASKKGISLTVPQWRRLQQAMGEIDRKLELQDGEEGPGGRAL